MDVHSFMEKRCVVDLRIPHDVFEKMWTRALDLFADVFVLEGTDPKEYRKDILNHNLPFPLVFVSPKDIILFQLLHEYFGVTNTHMLVVSPDSMYGFAVDPALDMDASEYVGRVVPAYWMQLMCKRESKRKGRLG